MGFIQFFNLSAQNILQKKKQQKFILLNIKTFIAKTCSQLEPCCGVKAARCKQVVAKKAGKIHGPSITLSGDKPTPTPHALHPLSILMNVLLNKRINRRLETTSDVPTNGENLRNVITFKVIWTNQNCESFVFCWQHAHASFDAFVGTSDVFSSVLLIC